MNDAVKISLAVVGGILTGMVGGWVLRSQRVPEFDRFVEGVMYKESLETTRYTKDIVISNDENWAKIEQLERLYSKEYVSWLKKMVGDNLHLLESFISKENRLKGFASNHPAESQYFRYKLEAYCLLKGDHAGKVQAMLNKTLIGM